jgi:hypothetical protein
MNLKIPIILFSKFSLINSTDKHDFEQDELFSKEYPQIIP